MARGALRGEGRGQVCASGSEERSHDGNPKVDVGDLNGGGMRLFIRSARTPGLVLSNAQLVTGVREQVEGIGSVTVFTVLPKRAWGEG